MNNLQFDFSGRVVKNVVGLNTAWMHAQDRSKWHQLVETAMLNDGQATR